MKRSCQEIETFMLTAKMRVLRAPAAVADDGTTQHRVFFHTSDDTYRDSANRDTWKANVAAYELTKILDVYIMPPYVETTVEGKAGSVSWGLDDVMMDEVQRNERNLQPPDVEAWNKQMHVVRVFDELVYHGRAPSDLLITKDWQLWIIGPSQAFRPSRTLQNPGNLVMCDRKLLSKIRMLDQGILMRRLGNWLNKEEIEALHARATLIVDVFDREVAARRGRRAVRSGPKRHIMRLLATSPHVQDRLAETLRKH
jgi:hypothetical protein